MTKVSIIIPCYNQGKYMKDALNSAINQTYHDIEIVCVNDGSTDNSAEIIENFSKSYNNIIFINEKENSGVVRARNLAIERASGEFILPLDADDKIESTYVEKAVKILENKGDVGIVYCRAKFFGEKNEEWLLPKFSMDEFILGNQIFSTAMFRKRDFLKVGGYKDCMKNGSEDWDLWLSFLEIGLKPYKIDEILFYYRQHKSSRSSLNNKNIRKVYAEILKNHSDLYINNQKIVEKIFENQLKVFEKVDKKIFYLISVIAIIELILIIFIL